MSLTKGEGADGPATLTVKVPGAKKKAPATERKFELSKGVKLETLTITKKVFSIRAAAVEDIKEGDRVLIQMKEGNADQPDRVILVAAANPCPCGFAGDPKRFVFQGVHMILDGDHQRPWGADEKRESRIVFIGRKLPEEMIRKGFESCAA